MKQANLQHFETFLTVADFESFTLAAKQLHLSKSAVSQAVRQLEESLQMPLFIRSTRKVTLTDEGEMLYSQCQRLQDELDGARELIGNLKGTASGVLRIYCNPHLAGTALASIIRQYRIQFPQVKIIVHSQERMPDMRKEKIDIVFGVNWPAPDDVIARKIGSTRYVLCATPEYFERMGVPKTIKELEQHEFIPHIGRQNFKKQIISLKQDVALNLNPKLKLDSQLFLKKAALFGWGIVQLHEYVIHEELADGSLVEVLREHLKPEVNQYMYYYKHHFVQPKVRQFVNLAMAYFNKQDS